MNAPAMTGMKNIPFIVLRFSAWHYYGPDVYLYYAAMFLIPVVAGTFTGARATAAGK